MHAHSILRLPLRFNGQLENAEELTLACCILTCVACILEYLPEHMLTDLRTQTSPYIFCESFSYTGLREHKRHRTAYVFCLTQTCYIGERKRHRIFFVKQVLDGLVDDLCFTSTQNTTPKRAVRGWNMDSATCTDQYTNYANPTVSPCKDENEHMHNQNSYVHVHSTFHRKVGGPAGVEGGEVLYTYLPTISVEDDLSSSHVIQIRIQKARRAYFQYAFQGKLSPVSCCSIVGHVFYSSSCMELRTGFYHLNPFYLDARLFSGRDCKWDPAFAQVVL